MPSSRADEIAAFAGSELAARGDAARATTMAAYMRTDMPFYGVQRPARSDVERELRRRFPVHDHREYRETIEVLWAQPHREEKYLALHVARREQAFISIRHLDLYRRLIVEGAWWDLVDEMSHVVGVVLDADRPAMRPVLDDWIDDDDLWLRRSAIISQLDLRGRTDADQLFAYCLRRAHEREFFIRKAIGWALRQYARVAPDEVRAFCDANRTTLSPLSHREAMKHLGSIASEP
jgi:3-methyladenine DNA glycosylase AlkD